MVRYRFAFPLVAVLLAIACSGTWSAVAYSAYNGLQVGSNGIRVGARANGYNRFSVNGTTGATAILGNLAVNTNKFTVTASSGNTLVAGLLSANGGVACDGDKLVIADGTGELTGSGPKHYLSVPIACAANSTARAGALVAHRGMTITKVSVAFFDVPASAAGTVTLALQNYDLSAGADDNLLGAATFDLEGIAAKTASDLALTGTSGDLVLADGDYVYAVVVSDNVDMTGGTGGVLSVEYTLD